MIDSQYDIAKEFLTENNPIIGSVLTSVEPLTTTFKPLNFGNTARIIINQQLSGKAAQTIFNRVLKKVGAFTPLSILNTEDDELRECGLSYAKISYIKGLADKCLSDKNYLNNFLQLTDEDALDRIKSNKGFGIWSAQIFLLFHLRRPDIFPIGDATLITSISEIYKFDKTDNEKIIQISKGWLPYRSIACLALWQWFDDGKPKLMF